MMALIVMLGLSAQAASNRNVVYQGRILRPDGDPVNAGVVAFTVKVYSPAPSSCLLYSETQNINMTNSLGTFSLNIGEGTATGGVAQASLPTIWTNAGTLSSLTCASGATTYSPTASDERNLVVSFNDAGTNVTLAPLSIRAVPYALQAEQLSGYGIMNVAKISGAGSGNAMTGTQFDFLTNLAASASASAAPCAAGEILKYNGTDWVCATDATGGAMGDASYAVKGVVQFDTDAATSGLNVVAGLVSINSGVGANQILKLDGTAKIPAVDGSQITNLNPSNLSAAVPVAKGGTGLAALGTSNQVLGVNNAGTAAEYKTVTAGTGISVVHGANAITINATGTGTVSSVGVSVPAYMSSTGGPVTTSGTIALDFASQAAKKIFASPNGAAGVPSFRSINISDVQSSAAGAFLVGGTCTAGQALTYDSVADNMTCSAIVAGITNASTLNNGKVWIGDIGNKAQEVTLSGDATVTNAGVVALKATGTAGTYYKVTTDAQGRVTSGAALTLGDITTALGYTPLNKAGDTMTGSLGLNAVAADPAGLVLADKGKVWYNTTSSQIKYWDGGSAVALGTAGSGLTSLGGQIGTVQTFAAGSAGNSPAINSAGDVHTLNVPLASAGAGVTSGTISNADYVAFNAKLGTSTAFSGDVSGAYNSTSVDKIKGTGVNITALTTGNFLQYNGTNWVNTNLAASDIPNLDTAKITTGVLPIARGGTNNGTLGVTAGGAVYADGTSLQTTAAGTSGQPLLSNGAGAPAYGNLAVGAGGTGATSFAADKLIVSNGTGSALQAVNCGVNQVMSFTGGGAITCADISTIFAGFVNGGNSFSGNATIGTNDNFTLGFKTNNTTKMTIDASGSVGIGTAAPNASSLVEMTSTTKGVLIPRMTTAQRDAIATPATGLQVYNTTTNALNYYNGTAWSAVGGGSIGGSGTTNTVPVFTAAGTIGDSIISQSGSNVVVAGNRLVTADAWNSLILTGAQATPNMNQLVLGSNGDVSTNGSGKVIVNGTGNTILKLFSGATAAWEFNTDFGGTSDLLLSKTAGAGTKFEIANVDTQLDKSLIQSGIAAPGVSAAGTGKIYFDSGTHKFRVSENGAAYADLVAAAGGGALSSLTAATAANSINNAANAQTWNWQLTGNTTAFNISENAASTGGTGTQDLMKINTLAASTANPLHVMARGAEALFVDSTGKVGIGTVTPKNLLHIGAGNDTPVVGANGITIQNTGATALTVRDATSDSEGFMFADWSGVIMGASTNHSLYLQTGNISRMLVDQSGNIGIGAVSPVDPLSVSTAINPSATHALVNLSNTALVGGSANGTYLGANPAAFTGNFIDMQVGGTSKFKVDNTGKVYGDGSGLSNISGAISGLTGGKIPKAGSATTIVDSIITESGGALSVAANSASTGLAVTQSGAGYAGTFMGGNVGVGTTAPIVALDVNGQIKGTTPGFGVGIFGNSDNGIGVEGYSQNGTGVTGSSQNGAGVSGTSTSASSGYFYSGWGGNTAATLVTKQGGAGWTADLFQAVSNSGTVLFDITSSGNIGIGTATPGAALEVAGQLKITGGTPGAGKVLTSDGVGLATWTTPAGGGTLSAITAATAANSINNAAYAQAWNWQLTGNTTAFNISENAASTGGTGTQDLMKVNTLAGSTANPLHVKAGAAEGLMVNSSGYVGIGTASPDSLLTISDSTANTYAQSVKNSSGNVIMSVMNHWDYGRLDVNDNNGVNKVSIEASDSAAPKILINSSGASIPDGNVAGYGAGLAIMTPYGVGSENGIFFTNATTVATNLGGAITYYTNSTANYGYGSLRFKTANGPGGASTRMMIEQTGNVGIGTASPVDPLSISTAVNASATHASVNLSNTALVGGSANGTYLGANPAAFTGNFIDMQVGGTSKFKVDNTGKVYGDGSGLSNISGAISGLTAGKIPKAGSATTIVDSIITESGGALSVAANSASTGLAVTQSGAGYAASFAGGHVVIDNAKSYAIKDSSNVVRPILTYDASNVTTIYAPNGKINLDGTSASVGVIDTGGDVFRVYGTQGGPTPAKSVFNAGNVGIGTASPTSILHTVASGAMTAAYTGNYLSNTATSSTAAIGKVGLDVQSTGVWNGATATNTGLNVNVSGGTTNYAATFQGGNVGIGTTSPGAALEVAGQVKITGGTPGAGKVLTSDGVGLATWSTPAGGSALSAITAATAANSINNAAYAQTWNWQLTGNTAAFNITENAASTGGTGTQDLMKINTLAASTANPLHVMARGAEALMVTSTGGVGINTASPDAIVTIKSAAQNTSIQTIKSSTGGTNIFAISNNWDGGIMSVYDTAGAPAVTVYGYGAAGPRVFADTSTYTIADATTQLYGSAYALKIPYVTGQENGIFAFNDSFSNGATAGVDFYTAATTGYGIGGIHLKTANGIGGGLLTRMTIDPTGNVGIGTTSPGAALEVAGQVKITGGSPGAGKVLTSDGVGLATWATPSGGGALSAITAATAANSINNAAYAQTWNWQMTGNTTGFNITENAASTGGTGTQDLMKINTLAASTANPLHVMARGAEALFVDSTGKVGIGTASPFYSVDIQGTSPYVGITSSASSSGILISRASGGSYYSKIDLYTGGTQDFSVGSGGVNSDFYISNTAGGTNYLTILKSNGNHGIGTTAPVDPVSVGIAVNANATHALVNLSNTALVGGSANGTYLGANPAAFTGNFIDLQVGGASKFKVDNTGKVYGDGSGLTGITPSYSGLSTSGVMYATSASATASTTSTDMSWDNTNKRLGIGTATPGARMDIVDNSASYHYGATITHTGPAGSYGAGLYVLESAASGPTANAILGEKTYTAGAAVFGLASAQSGSIAIGVEGEGDGDSGTGVKASATKAANTGYAIQAINNSSTGWGIYASGTSPNYFAGNVGIGTNAPAATLEVKGHIAVSQASSPSVSSCGGGAPSVTGNDTRGVVTFGTGAPTACTITFATAFATAPVCVVGAWGASPGAYVFVTSTSTTALVLGTSAAAASKQFSYYCIQ